jgi:hypothetical protein
MERYRDINVDHDWWDCTYDYWKSRLARLGVDVDEISFSGFWSQGDGACFTGLVSSKNIKRFMRIHGMREQYRPLYIILDQIEAWVGIYRSSSHYAHPYTVRFSADIDDPNNWIDSDTDDLREAMLLELYEQAMLWWPDFETDCAEILRGYMDDIYRDLEKEYEYLTSDEAVREAIEANELYEPEELTEQE